MIKIELHCHVLGGSICAKASSDFAIDTCKSAGYGAIVITNHYSKGCYDMYPGQTHKEKIDYFLSLYHKSKEYGNSKGIKVFLGAEVREREGTEYMLYGFDEKFLYDNKPLFFLDQKELFQLADKNKLFMYQPHPFRLGVTAGNPEHMHGAESFNGHFHHENNNDKAKEFCLKHNLIQMSGSDYHHEDQPFVGGGYIPDEINSNQALAEHILNGKLQIIENEQEYLFARQKYLQERNKCK